MTGFLAAWIMNLEALINNIPAIAVEAVCVAHLDEARGTYHVAWVNDAYCQMFSTSRESVRASDPFAMFHWDYVADFKSAMDEMGAAGARNFTQDTLCLRSDQSSFWGGVSLVRVTHGDPPAEYILIFVRDIDTLKNREQSAELALIENEHLMAKVEAVQSRLISAIEMSPDPFCIFDARDRLLIWNPAFAESVTPHPDGLRKGMKNEEIMAKCLANGFIDDAIGREAAFLDEYLAAWRDGQPHSPVIRIKGRDYKVIRSDAPNGDRVLLRVDISEHLRQQRELRSYAERLEQANREISEQALHDELTGLGNRRFLNAHLEDLKAARRSSGLEIAALHVDLDRFKQINDTMGHVAGDHVLRHVAGILKTRVRESDVVARIGGDEFIVLTLCARDSENPEKLADRLIAEICKPILFEDRPCRVGASVGIARTPMIPVEELITCSDIALYKAKSGGRATKATFDHRDLDALRSNKRLADDILRGVDEDEFVPLYQPQVDMSSGAVVALEVLTCWQHPERGLIPASQFQSTAMEVHADGKIDAIVFRKAIAACAAFFASAETAPTLGFNVGLSRLTAPDVLSDLKDLTYAGRIAFELNETVFLEDGNAGVFDRLDALRARGILLEVDDFGSGRASIVGLRRLGPERLKIDRRLIEPMTTSESARRLVSSIIEIGRALEIGITADGVSTEAHATDLKQLGCRRGQGTLFAAPGPLADFTSALGLKDPSKVA